MRRALPTALGLVALALALAPPLSSQEVPDVPSRDSGRLAPDDRVRALLAERIALGRNPGIVVGLLDAGGARFVALGESGREDLVLDTATVFEAGSVTKVLTADLLAVLAVEGRLLEEDPVATHLPGLDGLRGANGRPVRLVDLATHTSGLPRVPANLAPDDALDPYAGYAREHLLAALSDVELPGLPAPHAYSNLGVGLLGFTLGEVDGSGYEAAVRRRLLQPLSMDRSGFASDPDLLAALAQGHAPRGEPTGPWRFDALAGAGALLSTAPDLLRFAGAHLNPPPGPLGEALASTLEVRVAEGPAPHLAQALGWVVDDTDPRDPVWWHNGGTGGFRSFVGLRPGRGTAVVVLTNQSTSVDDLGLHLLDPDRALAPPPPAESVSEIRLPTATMERYVGRYRLAPGFDIEVTLDEGGLHARATGQGRLRLAPVSPTRFRVVGVDAAVTFGSDADGNVDHLILHQGGRDQRAERMPNR